MGFEANVAVTELNKFATSEGMPASMDGFVDAAVDTEANKYL